ncbi:MAG: serine/threonine protein kinase [Myxococcales bacterium]|nr:serine/threonine protein kinase [Myxococcales bacterium]
MIRVWEPGAEIDARYRLVERIGHGGMGSVWRAEHLMLGTPVAIKVLSAHAEADEDLRARFLREAKAAATLRGTNVVQLLDFGFDGRTPYLVMELLVGDTLSERLKRLGGLDVTYAGWVLDQVARAIAKAHRLGVLHRDLKPANIFLARDEDLEVPKILDFGLAKIANPPGVSGITTTAAGEILGTPFYMSPEQIRGGKRSDHRSDLWALSIIAYECVTGRRPFEATALGDLVLCICQDPIPPPSTHGPVPPGFDAWFARATEREKEDRFQSASEWADTLCAVLGLSAAERTQYARPPMASLPPMTRRMHPPEVAPGGFAGGLDPEATIVMRDDEDG